MTGNKDRHRSPGEKNNPDVRVAGCKGLLRVLDEMRCEIEAFTVPQADSHRRVVGNGGPILGKVLKDVRQTFGNAWERLAERHGDYPHAADDSLVSAMLEVRDTLDWPTRRHRESMESGATRPDPVVRNGDVFERDMLERIEAARRVLRRVMERSDPLDPWADFPYRPGGVGNSPGALSCERREDRLLPRTPGKRRKKAGRRAVSPEADQKIADEWERTKDLFAGNLELFARKTGRKPAEVRRALDRHRKAEKRAGE